VGVFSKLKKLFASKPRSNLPRIDVKQRFELLGRTGQGSMSKVWRARDKKLGRTVCLKLLDKVKTARFEARFVGLHRPIEGAICTALRHPNIVQTFEYGLTREGEPYLIMELIEGMGLNFLIETKSQQLNGKRIPLLIQLTEALEYTHKEGYLHRDICPRNVMVTQDGVVKLIDFGLAVPDLPDFRRPGNRTGTPNYLAPELIKRISTDQRVDLFALGVTAYETFTGQLPWEKSRSMETLQSHLNNPGKDPRDIAPDMDTDVAKFLIKSIERDPRDRFQTATEFREALEILAEKE
jgi:serine/threonine protein kinase